MSDPIDPDQAATKGDLHDLRHDMQRQMATMEQRILDHFDAAVENIEEQLGGANADEISLLKDADNNLHERLLPLERRSGIASPAPPHSWRPQ
jgi:hypothetical protein